MYIQEVTKNKKDTKYISYQGKIHSPVPLQGGDRQREFTESSCRFILLGENILLNKHVVTDRAQANHTHSVNKFGRTHNHPSEREHAQYVTEEL